MKNPPAIIAACLLFGAVFVAVMVLVIPWIDYAVSLLPINPFQWIIGYFAWCERKQAQMGRKP